MQPMAHEITHAPAFARLRVDLGPGQSLVAEAGAMAGRAAGFGAGLEALVVASIRHPRAHCN